jgi:TonB family protein
MLKNLIVLAFAFSASASIGASAQDVEKTLNDQYENKVLVLRHSVQADSQDYDAQGNLLTKAEEGSWTLFGRVLVESIKVSPEAIELTAQRVRYNYNTRSKHFDLTKNPKDKTRCHLRIKLEKPASTDQDAVAAMGKVFALNKEDVLNSVPEWWRSYVAEDLGVSYAPFKRTDSPAGSNGNEAYAVGGNVTAPHIIFQPEPQFTKEARKAKHQGVVGMDVIVGVDGLVHQITIVRPLGMGLDEKAMEGVRAWRFKPATRNGQPVAVAVYVEVDFRLYD